MKAVVKLKTFQIRWNTIGNMPIGSRYINS